MPRLLVAPMLEFAALGITRRARWPIEAEEQCQQRLKRLRISDWTTFHPDSTSEDESTAHAADVQNPLEHLEDPEFFSYDVACRCCNHCTSCEHGYLEADFQQAIQTEFGPVHVYIAGDRDKCETCLSKFCDCDRSVAIAVREIPSALVFSLDFRYLPGQSLTAIATTISGREVGRRALDLQGPATTNLDSWSLRLLAARWALRAGLLQSKQQKIELVVGLRLLDTSPITVLWSEEAERGPPRFRLRSKTNLRALRWQRYMETLCQPPPQGGMGRRPEEMA